MFSKNYLKSYSYRTIILFPLFLLFFISCGGERQPAGYGSINLAITWQDAPTLSQSITSLDSAIIGERQTANAFYAPGLDCVASGVSTVTAIAYDEVNHNQAALGGPWNCTEHSGKIINVPAGSNYNVVVLAKDSSGNVKYRGEQLGVSVSGGGTTDAAITASVFAPALTTPTDGSSVTAGSFTFNWTDLAGVSYQIQVANSTAFTTLSIDTKAATSYAPTITFSDGIYYWRVQAFDAYGNSSVWSSAWSFTVTSVDTTAPGNTTSANFINSGATSTTSATVSLALSATDTIGVTGYYIAENTTGTTPATPLSSAAGWTTISSAVSYSGTVNYNFTGSYTSTTTVYLYVCFKDAAGNVSLSSSDSISYVPPVPRNIPDTGQVLSYTTTTGEDSDYSLYLPSYTDNLDGTITDNVTGLVWQKGDGGALAWDAGNTYCNSNTAALPGTGWRLPTRMELLGIIDFGIVNPAINTTIFINTSASDYWSATANTTNASLSWFANFYYGHVNSGSMTDPHYVRCVRGQQQNSLSFTDNGDGTVKDNVTGLIWQQGESSTMSWETALSTCETSNLSGYTDWRLPNIRELSSIVDDLRANPAIDIVVFPGALSSQYWSSTTAAGYTAGAWSVGFSSNGQVGGYTKTSYNYNIRCVRGGPGAIQIGW